VIVPAELVVTLTHVGDQIKATWNDVHAETYEVHWFKDGVRFITELYPTNSVAHSPQGPGVYTVEARSLGTNQLVPGKWSKKSNALTQLAAPNVAFAHVQNETEIYVNLESDSEAYRMQLVKDGVPVGPIVTGVKLQPSARLNANDLPAGEYRVRVSATSSDDNTIPSPWIIARTPIYKLAAPLIASMSYTAERVIPREIIVTLQSFDPHTEIYCAQFVNTADGKPVGMIQRFRSANNIHLSLQDIPAGTYKVQLLASRINQNDGIASPWSDSGAAIVVLKQVTINQVALAGDMLMATWTECANATHYELALGEESPRLTPPLILHRIMPLAGQTKPPTMLKRPNTNLEPGKTYQVYVRPVADALVGEWSAAAPLKIQAPVKTQQSLSLNGGMAVIPLTAPLTLKAFTLEVWVKTAGAHSGGAIFNCDGAFDVFIGGGTMLCNVHSNGSGKAYQPLTAGHWHHVAVVYQHATVQFYLDGNLVYTANAGGTPGVIICNGRINIGGLRSDDPSNRFPGMLDELRIWNVARSEQDIQQNMHSALYPKQQPRRTPDPQQSSLLLYYNFDDGTGRELTGQGAELSLLDNAAIVQSDVPVTL
ncbi:MAG TPA: LamG domain-containing protein, partial [Blastocatellia bacterium]|nr:LamG domain-containing protein [Blastocatellia bacterium]